MAVDFNLSLKKSSWKVVTPSKATSMLPFYIEFIGDYETNLDFYTKRDGQQSYLIIYTVSGNAMITVKNSTYELTPNSIILINCNDYHYFKPTTDGWHYLWIHINGIGVLPYFKILYEDEPFPVKLPEDISFIEIFDNLYTLVDMPSIYNHILISDTISHILTKLASGFIISNSDDKNNKYIAEAIDYIENNYSSKLTIEEIADHVYISKYYLIKLFKKTLGISPYRYIVELRITKSKNLLISTDMSLNDISAYVGFNSTSHFIKLFKEHTGITPKKYRAVNKLEI